MTKPTQEDIREARALVDERIDYAERNPLRSVTVDESWLRTLRTALEQYQKPKTVSDTDVLVDKVALAKLIAKDKLYHELIMAVETKYPNESRHATALRYITERERRRDLGIEVEGETPDDKFNNEKDQ